MNPPGSAYFAYDKEQLLKALEGFDGDITVEDVTDGANVSSDAKQCHTVLLQILLEAICSSYVQNEQQKEILLAEICNRLSTLKLVNPSLLMDRRNPLRIQIKQKFFEFVRQVSKEVIPEAEVDSNVISFLESNNLSADPDICYFKCFEELKEIGRGGFGTVFKAKDKLTQHIYAVKKIVFNYKNDARFLKVMREAKNIAALDHPNVVHYNNAWVEVVPSGANKSTNISENLSYDECDKSRNEDNDISFCGNGVSAIVITENHSTASFYSSRTLESITGQKSFDENSNKSSQSVIFSDSAEYSKNACWTYESCTANTSSGVLDESSDSNSSDETADVDMSFSLNFNVQAMLYIQMEYCDCDLRFWLDERAKGNELPFDMDITEIFCNILNGLSHIHSMGIIHRDLKPQNIFYSKANNVLKIGDFGLATLHSSTINYLNDDHISNIYSTNIGTLPYAAPEQISSNSYDSKVDIYSLGIILIELMNTFSTSMEFSAAIGEVKNGKVTEDMKKLPHLVNLVTNLISKNPKDRMPAEEILAYCEEDAKAKFKEIEKALKEKSSELEKMTELLTKSEAIIRQKDEEIKKLRALLKKLNPLH